MSPLPDNINMCNGYQPRTRDVQGDGYYHPSEGEYGTVDHSTGFTWWSNPADARERTAVFGIVTGVLVQWLKLIGDHGVSSDMKRNGGHFLSV
ncbi:uncharacterized protein FFB20_08086 [Fusarium fujikuroi]|uniref:Uncharacterized protein n=2 Tax=Fusarium fujikuroi TaxID=5127 RepID=S0E8D4_GIBF5|nr:uncharacterized protein FFUJ_08803 [Fusarium fujikuroi IMI 58289]KLP10450.1 uncharacterized protein Y057_3654 [Fusarium fujikuroi]KLP19643.1 uncharacterized protein LW94_15233 [Fusarium fujikuroi]QGI66870.1 hypothetical protein CEK27_010841 [Fusarium fujikuroi]QGI84107.1 hypothetical protein CEK25_010836 [Fusarium fujikuroi]QGI97756.1 hypothetical protein CEK26_010825 [Fusarium fujikuroi]